MKYSHPNDQYAATDAVKSSGWNRLLRSCHAFLAWEQLERDDRPEVEQNVETRMVPRIRVPATTSEATPAPGVPSPRRVPTDTTEGLFKITAEQREIALPATGEPAVLTLQVINTSDIVDGYLVESLSAPRWLLLEPAQLRLLPGSEDAMAVRMRVSSATLVAAQTTDVMLRIRSMSQAPAEAELPVRITVPAIEAPVQLHPEPSLLRVRDRDTGSCTVVVDNSQSNQRVGFEILGFGSRTGRTFPVRTTGARGRTSSIRFGAGVACSGAT